MIRSLSKKYAAAEGRVSMAERDVEKGLANERFKVWEREKIKRGEDSAPIRQRRHVRGGWLIQV